MGVPFRPGPDCGERNHVGKVQGGDRWLPDVGVDVAGQRPEPGIDGIDGLGHRGEVAALDHLFYKAELLFGGARIGIPNGDGGGHIGRADEIRSEVRRIVSELRLSIFDLRADIQPGVGLGSALTSYVQQAGTAAGLTVHLVIDESRQRLPVAQETELLRIAQEAVTNVRRHAAADNLWVTYKVDPPGAFLSVTDDGQGMDSPRNDSFGLDIMQERAHRIGAQLSWRPRDGGGTVLEVALQPPAGEREE